MGKIKDKIILGLLIGFIGGIPKLAINEMLVRKGIEKKRFAEIVAGMFVTHEEATTRKGILFGTVGDLVTGSFLGIPLVYLLSSTGSKHNVVKGGMMGLVGLGAYRAIVSKIGYKDTSPTDVVSNVSLSITSTLWGITAGIMALKLGHKSIFEQEKASELAIKPKKETGLTAQSNYTQQTSEINHGNRVRRHIVAVPVRKR